MKAYSTQHAIGGALLNNPTAMTERTCLLGWQFMSGRPDCGGQVEDAEAVNHLPRVMRLQPEHRHIYGWNKTGTHFVMN